MTKKYKKLPGNTPMRTHSLWIGEHHLLYVHSRSFYEDYWRFSFKDIQVITVQKTNKIILLSIIFGLCSSLSVFAFFSYEGVIADVFLIIAIIFILLFLSNLLAGNTCACYLHTMAHPAKKLPSLRRLPRIKKAIRILQQEIEKRQGI